MPITLDLIADAVGIPTIPPLNPQTVRVQFICNTGGDEVEHDPTQPPDDRVRPSHAALHGKIFALDDPALPVPPLDFGCRCAISYLAVEDTGAEDALPNSTSEEPTTVAAANTEYLDDNVTDWGKVADAAKSAAPGKAFEQAMVVGRAMNLGRDLVRMILVASEA